VYGQITFSPLASYPTGQNPQSVVVGDVNNDGAPDAVVVNASSNAVTVLVNKKDGTGSFNAPLNYAVGAGPYSAVLADVNGDGKLDLVTANMTAGTISVLLGNGDGTFQSATSYNVLPATASGTPSPMAIAAGDINGDGKIDLVVGNSGTNNVSVLIGDGKGGFTATVAYATGTSPDSVALARCTSGPYLDILTANRSGHNISVLLSNGNGTFQSAVNYAAGYSPYAIVARDFDGDGKIDVAICDNMSLASGIEVLKGNGDGSFQKPVYYAGGKSPITMVAGDFNGDGKADLATLNTGTLDVSLFMNGGASGFAPAVTLASGATHLGAGVGDFDGDGNQDLLLANAPSGLTVLLNVTAYVKQVDLSPATLTTGASSTVTIHLTRSAPTGGVTVVLGTDKPSLVWVPANVVVPAGQTTATFMVSTTAPATGTATIYATLTGVTISTNLVVNAQPPAALKGDMDGDGKITILDVALLAKIAGGLSAAN
jgi:hypothetical protein